MMVQSNYIEQASLFTHGFTVMANPTPLSSPPPPLIPPPSSHPSSHVRIYANQGQHNVFTAIS